MGETKLQNLAEDYLKSENESLKEKIEEIESEIKELEEEEEKYQDLDDDLLQEVRDEKEEKQQECKNLEKKIENFQELENEILEKILNGFKLEELNEEVIRAINGIVHGKEKKFILVRGHKIEPDEELDIEKKENRLIRHQVKRIANDIVNSDDEKIQQTWEKIESGKKLDAFEIIADGDGFVSPDRVSDELDVDRSKARNRMKSSRYQLPLNPYYVKDGDYTLSLLGKYLNTNYYNSNNEQKEESIAKEPKEDSSEKVTQSKFMDEVSE